MDITANYLWICVHNPTDSKCLPVDHKIRFRKQCLIETPVIALYWDLKKGNIVKTFPLFQILFSFNLKFSRKTQYSKPISNSIFFEKFGNKVHFRSFFLRNDQKSALVCRPDVLKSAFCSWRIEHFLRYLEKLSVHILRLRSRSLHSKFLTGPTAGRERNMTPFFGDAKKPWTINFGWCKKCTHTHWWKIWGYKLEEVRVFIQFFIVVFSRKFWHSL